MVTQAKSNWRISAKYSGIFLSHPAHLSLPARRTVRKSENTSEDVLLWPSQECFVEVTTAPSSD